MQKKIKWGILGCAGIAEKQFLPALKNVNNAELWALGSSEKIKAENWQRRWGAQRAYGSYDEVLADPQVEAVYIPLPNHLHKKWTIRALQAKKHVLCEKPMATTLAECDEMLKSAKEENRIYMEGFMYRFHPQIQRALDWVATGEIGEVRLVRGCFTFLLTDPTNVRLLDAPGGGSLWDVGCYPIHLTNLVFGGPPHKVVAQGEFKKGTQVDLSMGGLLDYGLGRRGIFDCSFQTEQGSFVEIVGDKGTITIPEPWRPDSQEVTITLQRDDVSTVIKFTINNPYQLEIEHFQELITGEKESLLPGTLGRDVVATILACYQSALEGKEVKVTNR